MMNRILASKFGVALWAAMMIGSAGRLRADEGGALKAIPQRPGFDFSKWETVHVQEGGVEKSLYTYANENVRELTGKANFAGRGPMENFFSMAFEPELWGNEPVVKISYPDVKKVFGDRRRVSPLEFEAKIPELRPLAEKKKEVNQELMHGMQKIDMLLGPAQGLKIVPAVDLRGEKSDWLSVEELASKTKNKTPQEEKLIAAWSEARMAFVGGDAAKFNEASSRAVEALNSLDVPTFSPAWKFSLDAWNTKIGVFRLAGWVYLMAGNTDAKSSRLWTRCNPTGCASM
ncbi:hypothetical protein HY256_00170 [Candidatus Sumerlaeota bacterium]|nr:hypothetical protein [Candidatus Sumerlaeota bacterium]